VSPEEASSRVAEAMVGFESFCGLLQIRPKVPAGTIAEAKRLQMELTPLQLDYCEQRTGRDIVLKPRQVYFTTLEGARDVWWFLTKPGAHVVVVCQSQTDQAALNDISEKFRIFFDALRTLGLVLNFGVESRTEWTLPDRDAMLRIIQAGASEAAADRKGRGGTINRLHFTEMAFWGDYGANTFLSLTSSVADDGTEIVNESTANGAGGFYYDQWQAAIDGKSAYRPHFVAWYRHHEYSRPLAEGEVFEPRTDTERGLVARGVTPEQINWRRKQIEQKGGNEDAVNQEYPSDPDTCFLVEGRNFFDVKLLAAQIAEAIATPGEQLDSYLTVYEPPDADQEYVIGADPAEGDPRNDPSAASVLERGTCKHVASLHGPLAPEDFARHLAALGYLYNTATIAVERNNHGHTVLRELVRPADPDAKTYPRIYAQSYDEGGQKLSKLGWLTHETSRGPMLDTFEAAHRRSALEDAVMRATAFRSPDVGLLGEMRTFVINRKGKPEGQRGSHDDRVLATAIAYAVATRATGYDGALPGVVPMESPMEGW